MMLFKSLIRTPSPALSERQRRIRAFLRQQDVGVLSTVTPNCDPHGVVIYYAVEDDFTIWFLTKKGTRKNDNIEHNGYVMLTVFDPHSQTTVQISGTATEDASAAAVNKVSSLIFRRLMQNGYGQLPPIIKLQAGAFTAFAIKPAGIRMAIYSRPDPGDYDQLFESIESFDLHEV
jgi:hypothetical protein